MFCFFNKARDKVKVLHWDTSGFCLYLKRLEKGRFHLGAFAEGEAISPVTLQLILEGLELAEAKRHRRFDLQRAAAWTIIFIMRKTGVSCRLLMR